MNFHTSNPQDGRTAGPLNSLGATALALLTVGALLLTGCSNKDKAKNAKKDKDDKKTEKPVETGQEQVTKKMTSTEVLGVDTQFKTFIELVKTANLDETVNNEELTLFVPNTEAFTNLGEGVVEELSKDHDALGEYLKQYMVKGTFTLNDLHAKKDTELDTLAGTKLKVAETEDHNITVNGAPLIKFDIETSNATIHVMSEAFKP